MLKRVRQLLVIAAAVGLALVAFALAAHSSFSVGPVTVGAAFHPGVGRTTLALPPFGSVDARTHDAPMQVELRLEDVAISEIQRWVAEGVPTGDTIDTLRSQLMSGLRLTYALGVFAAALTCGLMLLASRMKPRRAALVVGTLVSALVLVGVWGALAFDEGAFAQPTYRGALTYAPGFVSTVQERLINVGELRDTVRAVAGDLASYYGTSQVFASGGAMPGTVRVLHISDTHLDPVGGELAIQLAEAFDVAFVLHTGDINVYGTSFEASAAVAALDESRPLVFVPGNHDSPAVTRALAGLEGVTVLENTSTVV
ncbi:MAG: metallophosphoesterase, partial [Actinobacteria bacterium]